MTKVIFTTPEELASLIDASIQNVVTAYLPRDASPSDDKLFNINEAAEYLNLAKQTIYGFTSRGKIPYIKRSKRLLFRKSDLDQWLSEKKFEAH